jgi:UDP-N-acetylmuramate: L-alanyl-gamma-D-glutamyl-meso-diaminopimelate ligase
MGALAGLLRARGHDVRGSDTGIYPPMSDQLAALQIPVFDGYSAANLDWGPDQVVVGNVCTKDHVEVVAAQERGLPLTSLPAVLGEAFLADRHSVVVAGTHGKTTTAAVLTHILVVAGRDPGSFIGGVPLNLGQGWRLGSGAEFVVEGDEYDSAFFDKESKFLHYRPRTAILTSIELDHVDIFSSMEAVREAFRKFVRLIPEDGLLLVAAREAEAMAIAGADASCRVETYGVRTDPDGGAEGEGEPCVWEAVGIEYTEHGRCTFELVKRGESFGRFESLLTGDHNIANVVAASAVALSLGVGVEELRRAVAAFAGVSRRQELRGMAQGVYVIDDYGHHPTSVARTLAGLRKRFAGRRLVAIYEPRSATSRRRTFQQEYAEALGHADMVVVGKPYDISKIPEEERFDPAALALELHQRGTRAAAIEDVGEIVKHTVEHVRPGDVVVVFSSGSFDGLHDRLLAALGDAVVPACRDDLNQIRQLLRDLDLDWQDIDGDAYSDFLCLVNEHGFVGCVGLEVFGGEAVLRSLAVRPQSRGVGYGWMLADAAINRARIRGVRRIYLVTENASDFFAEKHGFRVVDSSTVSAGIVDKMAAESRRGRAQVAMRLDL